LPSFTKNVLNFEPNTHTMTIQESLLSAEEEIKPFLSLFKECYEKAIEKYNAFLSSFAAPLYNRTRAIVFQNIIVNEIISAFSGMPNVNIVEKYESISLVLNNHISARFKKLNKKGLPSNHRSHRNNALIAQQLEISYLEYPPIARVDVCYDLDATGMQYDLLKVMCRKNNQIIWDLYFNDINEGVNADTAIEISTPINPEHKKAQ
jgi:hypothetical protein